MPAGLPALGPIQPTGTETRERQPVLSPCRGGTVSLCRRWGNYMPLSPLSHCRTGFRSRVAANLLSFLFSLLC